MKLSRHHRLKRQVAVYLKSRLLPFKGHETRVCLGLRGLGVFLHCGGGGGGLDGCGRTRAVKVRELRSCHISAGTPKICARLQS